MTIEENLSIAYNKIRKRGLQAGISKADRELFQEKLSLLGMGLEDRMKENAGAASVFLTPNEVRVLDDALDHMDMSAVFGGTPLK